MINIILTQHSLRQNFISLSTQCNLILRLSCRLSNSTISSKSIFSTRILSIESVYQCFQSMEFLGNVFIYFIFEKLLSYEAVVKGRVTATSNNQTQLFKQLQMKKCSSDVSSFDAFRSKFFANVISCIKSFSLNENDLRILSYFFLIEMFALLG